mgnify:CR=1 FL=1
MPEGRALIGQASRFGVTGLINTAVGYAVIVGLDVGLHVRPALANVAGYAVGIPLGFALNRRFVFRQGGAISATGWRYIAVIAPALALNQLVLREAGAALGEGVAAHAMAQLASIVAYTAVSFPALRLWVFRKGGA